MLNTIFLGIVVVNDTQEKNNIVRHSLLLADKLVLLEGLDRSTLGCSRRCRSGVRGQALCDWPRTQEAPGHSSMLATYGTFPYRVVSATSGISRFCHNLRPAGILVDPLDSEQCTFCPLDSWSTRATRGSRLVLAGPPTIRYGQTYFVKGAGWAAGEGCRTKQMAVALSAIDIGEEKDGVSTYGHSAGL